MAAMHVRKDPSVLRNKATRMRLSGSESRAWYSSLAVASAPPMHEPEGSQPLHQPTVPEVSCSLRVCRDETHVCEMKLHQLEKTPRREAQQSSICSPLVSLAARSIERDGKCPCSRQCNLKFARYDSFLSSSLDASSAFWHQTA